MPRVKINEIFIPEQKLSLFNPLVLKLQVIYELEKCRSSYYSVKYRTTALKICHDTEHQKVGEQHSSQITCNFDTFAVISDLLNGKS